jgi:hypothetical protein
MSDRNRDELLKLRVITIIIIIIIIIIIMYNSTPVTGRNIPPLHHPDSQLSSSELIRVS